jgi:hypothetical protein
LGIDAVLRAIATTGELAFRGATAGGKQRDREKGSVETQSLSYASHAERNSKMCATQAVATRPWPANSPLQSSENGQITNVNR